ncbi:hypothetical protein HAL013_04680 [Helicobacter ailurogastricus]|nr:hypothetical protein HAL011_07870 [Helicobacter ailurogastricus]CRF42299.1 hypothetical protein HAL013_04680 [Helicobacter ailurogastricus]CRF44803.1 hypothetical protein HAL09_14150 [Helicobacter ailurogastricus]
MFGLSAKFSTFKTKKVNLKGLSAGSTGIFESKQERARVARRLGQLQTMWPL